MKAPALRHQGGGVNSVPPLRRDVTFRGLPRRRAGVTGCRKLVRISQFLDLHNGHVLAEGPFLGATANV